MLENVKNVQRKHCTQIVNEMNAITAGMLVSSQGFLINGDDVVLGLPWTTA